MYNDIGRKIKGLAVYYCISGIIISFIAMIVTIVVGAKAGDDGTSVFFGFLILVIGSLASWISSWILYGFGELIDKTSDAEAECETVSRKMDYLIDAVYSIRQSITEEEYTANDNDPGDSDQSLPPDPAVYGGKVRPIPTPDGIMCPLCKTQQKANRTVCWECGVHFETNGNNRE